jgi:hypothetical protein
MTERHRNVPEDFVRDPGRRLATIGAIEAAEFSTVSLSLGGRMQAQRGVGEKIGGSHAQGLGRFHQDRWSGIPADQKSESE